MFVLLLGDDPLLELLAVLRDELGGLVPTMARRSGGGRMSPMVPHSLAESAVCLERKTTLVLAPDTATKAPADPALAAHGHGEPPSLGVRFLSLAGGPHDPSARPPD